MDLLRARFWAWLGLILLAATALHAAGPKSPKTPPPYVADQEFDRSHGLLAIPWKINFIRMRVRGALPAQMQPGFPPYDQQPQQAKAPPPAPPPKPSVGH
jgi:hypothetical protein